MDLSPSTIWLPVIVALAQGSCEGGHKMKALTPSWSSVVRLVLVIIEVGGPKSEERMLLSMVMEKLSVWGEGKIASVALKLELVKQKDAQRLAV